MSSTGGVSKSQLAYQSIKQRIGDGTYSPGYRLVLGRLAEELGVSVVPVREAVRMLEAEGLVTFERNVGAQVAMLDPAEYRTTMQTLSLVEGYATAISAPHITADDLARARAINDRMAASLQHFDPVEFTRLNLEFHGVLFENCPNSHVLDLVHRGWARMRALRESTFSFVPGRAQGSVDEHSRLLDLIEHGAPPLELEMAARNHRLGTLDAFLEHQASPLRPFDRLRASQAQGAEATPRAEAAQGAAAAQGAKAARGKKESVPELVEGPPAKETT